MSYGYPIGLLVGVWYAVFEWHTPVSGAVGWTVGVGVMVAVYKALEWWSARRSA